MAKQRRPGAVPALPDDPDSAGDGAPAVFPESDMPAASELESALYIEAMCAELRRLAKTAGLDALAYFLDMARLEASIQVESRAASARRGR